MTLPLRSLKAPPSASMGSSYVVAEVEYESWAEELRLCGGDATLMSPSDILAFGIELPSPLPFNRLGVLDVGLPAVGLSGLRRAECLDLLAARFADSGTRGLPGRLPLNLLSFRGGCGNEFMLMTLRRVLFEALLALEGDRCCRADAAVMETGSRKLVVESEARRPLGLLGAVMDEYDDDDNLAGFWRVPVLFRVRSTGSFGSGMVGGPPFDDLAADGRGMVAAMLSYLFFFFFFLSSSSFVDVDVGAGARRSRVAA
jgi:hypothetical protein